MVDEEATADCPRTEVREKEPAWRFGPLRFKDE
jgi:hypothetical protein